MTAGIVDENLPHEPGGHREEMDAIISVERFLIHQPQVGFVNQRCALQSVTVSLAQEVTARDFTEFLVHEGDQAFERLLVSTFPSHEEFANGLRRSLGHVPTTGGE
jgi:hypothetical protein